VPSVFCGTSPEYGLRSYAYLLLHALFGKFAQLLGLSKVCISLAFALSTCSARTDRRLLFRARLPCAVLLAGGKHLSPRRAPSLWCGCRLGDVRAACVLGWHVPGFDQSVVPLPVVLLVLDQSAAHTHSSIFFNFRSFAPFSLLWRRAGGSAGYLPSTFAMYCIMAGYGTWLRQGNAGAVSQFWTVFLFELGALLGWPFCALCAVPVALNVCLPSAPTAPPLPLLPTPNIPPGTARTCTPSAPTRLAYVCCPEWAFHDAADVGERAALREDGCLGTGLACYHRGLPLRVAWRSLSS